LNGEYVIDYKTGGQFVQHAEQVVAYGMAVEKMYNTTLAGAIIIYLNSGTKSGITVKVIDREDFTKHFEMFLAVSRVYDLRNGTVMKERLSMPSTVTYKAFDDQLKMNL